MKKNILDKLNIRTEFAKNVLKLFSGTALGNAIAFLALPVLTRLYTKETLGDLQLFLSTITTFGVVSALKYELAIVLPKDKRAGNYLIILSLLVLILFSTVISALFFIFGESFLRLLNAAELKAYVYFISLGIFLMGLMQVMQYVLVRFKKFGELARNKVIQILVTQIIAIGFGFMYPSFIILLIAQLTGFFTAAALVLLKGYFDIKNFRLKELLHYAIEYKKFPLVNTSLVFLNTLSLQLPVFMFKKYFSSEVVGLYMVANRLVNIPLNLFGRSVSQVYLQSASEAYHEGGEKLLKIYKNTVKKLALIAVAPIFIVLVAAPFLVEIFLGSQWREAGVFMQIITFWVYFQFINMPISSTFTIINRQEIGFYLVVLSLGIRFLAMYIFRSTPYQMLFALSISAGFFYIVYNLSIYLFIKRLK